jgi:hypothetical protein
MLYDDNVAFGNAVYMIFGCKEYMLCLSHESARWVRLDPPLSETSWFLQPLWLSSLPSFCHFFCLIRQMGVKGILMQFLHEVFVLGLDSLLEDFPLVPLK